MDSNADELSGTQWSPQYLEKKCLSPLIIPVSVPVSKGPDEGSMHQSFTLSTVSKGITQLSGKNAVHDFLCSSLTGNEIPPVKKLGEMLFSPFFFFFLIFNESDDLTTGASLIGGN